MNENEVRFDWSFALRWLVSVAVGSALGFMTGFLFLWTLGDAAQRAAGGSVAALAGGALFGGLVSLGANAGPAFLLARFGIPANRWLVYSALITSLTVALVLFLAWPTFEGASDATTIAMMGLALGLPQGFGQALLLRGRSERAFLWAPITTAAYLVAVAGLVLLSGEGSEWLALGSTGLLLGLISALGITWLLRERSLALPA